MNPNSTSTPWFGISMGLIGFIVGYTIAVTVQGGLLMGPGNTVADVPTVPTAPTAPTEPEAFPSADNLPEVSDEDYIRGDADAPITIVEYSDFECPFCQRHHPTMQQVLDAYEGDVNWVYRHFPLSFHPMAQKAAEAAECAGEMGGNDKFWEYADLLFEKGPDNTKLGDLAAEIGLNKTEFQTCVDSGKHAAKIAAQMSGGQTAGVSGTPGNIIVNNETGETRVVSGARPFADFDTVIKELMGE